MLTHLHRNTQTQSDKSTAVRCESEVLGADVLSLCSTGCLLVTVVDSVCRRNTVVFSPDSLFTQLLRKRGNNKFLKTLHWSV